MSTAGRFVGQKVLRREDPRLLTGHGRFVDDVMLPGMLHCTFVRSDVARGHIVSVDVSAARTADGVVAVFTGADLNAAAGTLQPTLLLEMAGAPHRALAEADVRFVGDPIALVVATSRYLAEDAAELIEVEIDVEPAVIGVMSALADGAPLVHPELASNVGQEMPFPIAPELEALLRGEGDGVRVVTHTIRHHRQTPVPMETRGIVARYEPATRRAARVDEHAEPARGQARDRARDRRCAAPRARER